MGVSGRLKESWDDRNLKVPNACGRASQLVKLLLNGSLPAFSQSPTPAGMDRLDLDEHFEQLISHFGVTGCLRPCSDVRLGRHLVAVLDLRDLRACPAKRVGQLHGLQPGTVPQGGKPFGESSGL